MTEPQIGLRERTRRAVQKEITDAANALFLEHGFEATTIDQIAGAVGMSQRSVFRYFPTKEDIVLGKFDFTVEEMIAVLKERAQDEPVWTSLRRMFDVMVAYEDGPEKFRVAEPIQRIVFGTPALFAGYLQRLNQLQDGAVEILRLRAKAAGAPYAQDDPAPRALAAAACGCMVAAQYSWLGAGCQASFIDTLDRAMSAVGPTSGD